MDQPKKHDIRLDPRFSNKKLREYYRLLLVSHFIVATVIADFLKTGSLWPAESGGAFSIRDNLCDRLEVPGRAGCALRRKFPRGGRWAGMCNADQPGWSV